MLGGMSENTTILWHLAFWQGRDPIKVPMRSSPKNKCIVNRELPAVALALALYAYIGTLGQWHWATLWHWEA
jgi:hypothetical protein